MSMLSRFTDILSANINALLDKAEDPAKMIDQYLIKARKDLADVKQETAAVMAEETRAKRMLDENKAEVAKYQGLAVQALQAGNEGDAKIFLAKKQGLETTGASLETAYAVAHENATKMRQLHDKLTNDIAQLEAKKATIKAKVSIANTQETVNKYTGSADKFDKVMGEFEKMEQKADKMLDIANAKAELEAQPVDEAAALEAKYQAGVTDSVESELAKLKEELGL
ncbi:MAG: PspA/IM30 family protein [Clostridia bacterium]|nr:PspA/IM30 family protein [Clostridia bacterium]